MKKINLHKIDFKKGNGLIPAVVQDPDSGLVLMVGWMDRAALTKTIKTKKVWFYSRTKKRLWMKGETSGHTLTLIDIKVDCDADTLLVKARPNGPVCHTGADTCFGEKPEGHAVLSELFAVIESRKRQMPKDSYTTYLFTRGLRKICAKVEEESGEVLQAARKETKKRLIEESVDLLYHLFVLLAHKGVKLDDVSAEASRRRR